MKMNRDDYDAEVLRIIKGAPLINLYEIYFCMSTGEFAELTGCSEEDQSTLLEIVKREIKEKRVIKDEQNGTDQ